MSVDQQATIRWKNAAHPRGPVHVPLYRSFVEIEYRDAARDGAQAFHLTAFAVTGAVRGMLYGIAPFVLRAALFDSHRNSPPKATPCAATNDARTAMRPPAGESGAARIDSEAGS